MKSPERITGAFLVFLVYVLFTPEGWIGLFMVALILSVMKGN